MWKLRANPAMRSVTPKLVHPGSTNTSSVLDGQTTRVTGSAGKFLKVNWRDPLVFRDGCTEVTTHPRCRIIRVGVTHVATLAGIGGNFFWLVSLEIILRAMWVF